ncbi:hypothetical protein B0H13DRAFT_2344059 [Mycena leptocephala]|nr:hypothetical protein B0H13DRAFT_2344059 [Mycena leptocephala]
MFGKNVLHTQAGASIGRSLAFVPGRLRYSPPFPFPLRAVMRSSISIEPIPPYTLTRVTPAPAPAE